MLCDNYDVCMSFDKLSLWVHNNCRDSLVTWGKVFLTAKCQTVCVLQGYHGCAVGKAKQAAKTEIEKLKVSLSACQEK